MSDTLFPVRRSAYTGRLSFDGPLAPGDAERLPPKLQSVYDVLRSGEWLSLPEIAERAGVSLLSVGSRVRDLRKKKFGGYDIEQKPTGEPAVHVYRMVKP